MDYETFPERNERLGSHSGRQEQISLVLSAFERPRGDDAEGDLEALRMLLVDALMDHDDYALRLAVEGLHRAPLTWPASAKLPAAVHETKGELRGLLNVASMALERMVPLAVLAELAPDGLPQNILRFVAENPGCSNDELAQEFGTQKSQVSRAGRRLSDRGLVRKVRTGTRNSWQATPRGLGALNALASQGPRPIRRQRAHA